MFYRLKQLAVVSACLSDLLCTGTAQAEVTVRAISAWPEGNQFLVNFERFITKVNAEGRGLVQTNYLGRGAKVMPPFEVGNAVKNGVTDIAHVAGGFYINVLPEPNAPFPNTKTTSDLRKNGGYGYINKP